MCYTFEGKRCRNYYILLIIICIINCVLFSGCRNRETKRPAQYGYISYVVQWDSILKCDAPKETLRFCFYPADNGPMIQTDTDSGSLKIALAPGKYGLLVYNYGENHLLLRNRTNFEQTEATFVTDENGCSQIPSAPLYGVVIKEFEILPNQDVTTTIIPTLFTKKVYFKIGFKEEHFKQIRDCQGMLTGVTPQLHVCNRTVKRDSTTRLPILFEKNGNTLNGQVLLLDGIYDGENRDQIFNELTINFSLKDGSNISSSVNMGPALFNIKRQDIMVDINGLFTPASEQKVALECESIKIHERETNL